MRKTILFTLTLAACNPVSGLKDPVPEDLRNVPYPDIIPLNASLTAPVDLTPLGAQTQELEARSRNLTQRADALDDGLDDATRAQLTAASQNL